MAVTFVVLSLKICAESFGHDFNPHIEYEFQFNIIFYLHCNYLYSVNYSNYLQALNKNTKMREKMNVYSYLMFAI